MAQDVFDVCSNACAIPFGGNIWMPKKQNVGWFFGNNCTGVAECLLTLPERNHRDAQCITQRCLSNEV